MEHARAVRLADGRLHLQHGPIDIVADADGPGRTEAFERAADRFEGLLEELVSELPALRRPVSPGSRLNGPVARRMQAATLPFAPTFVTPMAAVAGAVADEIVAAMASDDIRRAHVNNGGDVALYLSPDTETVAAVASPVPARVTIRAEDPVRGVATSGWRGRSHSLGIADSVTVLAPTAAGADVAATLIANVVDLPDHPGIRRFAASSLSPDSDLGDRRVTVEVPPLRPDEVAQALETGRVRAAEYVRYGRITAAFLVLQGQVAEVGDLSLSCLAKVLPGPA